MNMFSFITLFEKKMFLCNHLNFLLLKFILKFFLKIILNTRCITIKHKYPHVIL
jgi:hypothetical protein